MSRRTASKLVRIVLAFGAFIGVLCAGLYLGFVAKFQTIKNTDDSPSQRSEAQPVFYKRIGQKALPSNATSQAKTPTSSARYALELKVFRDQASAEKYVANLTSSGVQAYYTPMQHKGRVIFRVREGLYRSSALAQRASDRLMRSRSLEARVVKLQ